MIIKQEAVLRELTNYVEQHISFAKKLLQIDTKQLQFRDSEKSWSVLDCLEHLNLYAQFYNPEIKKRMVTSKKPASLFFKSGFLGNKFALDMLPKKSMKTMSTFKSKNPIHSNLDKETVLLNFISNQEILLELLTMAKEKNITKIKTAITLPLLKFRLGDTFRFVIYHNERHIVQAKKVLRGL